MWLIVLCVCYGANEGGGDFGASVHFVAFLW